MTPFRLLLAACLGGLCGCSGPAASFSPTPALPIEKVSFLGSTWNQAQARASIIAQDGGESFPVPGGSIWAFGDTFKGRRAPDGTPNYAGGAISCALAFLPKDANVFPPDFQYLTGSDGKAASPFRYLASEKPEKNFRLWPLAGIELNGRYYLYYSVIHVLGSGCWDFHDAGAGLAVAKNPLGPYRRLLPGGHWKFPAEPTVILPVGKWLYLYSVRKTGKSSGVYLARVRPKNIEKPDTYEFHSSGTFSSDPASATCLVPRIFGQVSIAWNEALKKYVMASSSDFSRPREIRFLIADAPEGPWSQPVARIRIPAGRQGRKVNLVYCSYLHPELFEENGRLMRLTYSLNLKDALFDANNEMLEIRLRNSAPK